MVEKPDRRVHPGPARIQEAQLPPEADRRTLIRGSEPRPDRPAAHAGGGPGLLADAAPRPTRSRSTGCSPRPITASGWPSPGSTSSGSPTPWATTATRTSTSSRIATTSSTPSTATSRSTSSRSSNWPATSCPNPTPEQLVGDRLQPPEHDDARRRRPAQGISRQVPGRPGADGGR